MADHDGNRPDDGWAIEKGWTLAGADGAGRPVRLVLGDTELGKAYLGIVLGRHPALCTLVIDDQTVSRRHCRFGLIDGDLVVEDLNSLNGTLIEGDPVARFRPEPVLAGERLTLGRVILTVQRLPDR